MSYHELTDQEILDVAHDLAPTREHLTADIIIRLCRHFHEDGFRKGVQHGSRDEAKVPANLDHIANAWRDQCTPRHWPRSWMQPYTEGWRESEAFHAII